MNYGHGEGSSELDKSGRKYRLTDPKKVQSAPAKIFRRQEK